MRPTARSGRAVALVGALLLVLAHAGSDSIAILGLERGGSAPVTLSSGGAALVVETLAGVSSADAAPKDVEQVSQVLGTASPFERPARLLLAEVESSEALPLAGAVLHPSAHASVPDAVLKEAEAVPTDGCRSKTCLARVAAWAVQALGDAGVTLESGAIRQGAAQLVLSEPSATQLLQELAALHAKALSPLSRVRVSGLAALEAKHGASSPEATLARRLVAAALAEAARSQAVVVCQAAPGSLGALPAPSARRLAEASSTASPDTTARAVAWITGIALLLAVLGAVYAMLGAENRSDTSLFGVTKSHTQ